VTYNPARRHTNGIVLTEFGARRKRILTNGRKVLPFVAPQRPEMALSAVV